MRLKVETLGAIEALFFVTTLYFSLIAANQKLNTFSRPDRLDEYADSCSEVSVK